MENQSFALMDEYRYEMNAPALGGMNDLLIPAQDLVRIYSPAMKAEIREHCVTLKMNGVEVTLRAGNDQMIIKAGPLVTRQKLLNTPQNGKDAFYLPVGAVMQLPFSKTVRSSTDMNPQCLSLEELGTFRFMGWPKSETTVCISEDSSTQLTAFDYRKFMVESRGKAVGNLYHTYWMDGPQKVIPYIVYIPTTYDPQKPTKMVVFLHGGSINAGERYAGIYGGHQLQKYAEKYNYILLMTNACTLLSAYGNLLPGMKENSSPEELAYYQWGDDSVMQAMQEVQSYINIDKTHIYLMGNSMGGGGTAYLPSVHPGMFRALAGGVLLSIARPIDFAGLRMAPILIPAGTEDEFGYDNYLESVKILRDEGVEVKLVPVAGGQHLTAWAEIVDQIFEWFEQHQ